ncbi:MAG: hypothetical protein ACJ76F_08055 [Bacteroidia bacterium]
MKKVLSIIAIAGLATAFVACGPSKEEMEAKEKAKQDSIRMADSIAAATAAAEAEATRVADSTANAEKMKMMADSMHADSVAKKLIKVKK